jgi:hypothetical protein
MQPNALLIRWKFYCCKKRVLQSQGVRCIPQESWVAFPLTLRSDAAGDCSPGYYTDHLQQAWGNTNSALERQAKSTDELLRRLIEEQDEKKHIDSNVNPSSATSVVSFAQINPHTSGPSAGGISMPNPSTHMVNHFHSRTTIEGSAPNLGMPQQTIASMFKKGYTHTSPNFTIPNPSSAPYTSMYNDRAYPNPNGNYQVP